MHKIYRVYLFDVMSMRPLGLVFHAVSASYRFQEELRQADKIYNTDYVILSVWDNFLTSKHSLIKQHLKAPIIPLSTSTTQNIL